MWALLASWKMFSCAASRLNVQLLHVGRNSLRLVLRMNDCKINVFHHDTSISNLAPDVGCNLEVWDVTGPRWWHLCLCLPAPEVKRCCFKLPAPRASSTERCMAGRPWWQPGDAANGRSVADLRASWRSDWPRTGGNK